MKESITRLGKYTAPYGKEVTLENITYENGMRVLRVHIREGNRFTVMYRLELGCSHDQLGQPGPRGNRPARIIKYRIS